MFAVTEKKIYTIFFPYISIFKLNHAVAFIMGLQINIKNTNFVKNHPLIIHV